MTEKKSPPVTVTFARRLRAYRNARGWSVRQLAEECARIGADRLTQASLSNLERAQSGEVERKSREVTADELLALAIVLNVPPISLLLPVDVPPERPFELTGDVVVGRGKAWQWAKGDAPLPRAAGQTPSPDQRQEYESAGLPIEERRARQQVAGRVVDELREDVYRLALDADFVIDDEREHERFARYLANARSSVQRLIAEIDRIEHVRDQLTQLGKETNG